eukprot:c47628_g1_i1 orf=1-606(-)
MGGGGAASGSSAAPQHLAINFSKRPFIEDVGPRKIKSICFNTMSPQEISKAAELQVVERSLYQLPERQPFQNGVLDARMGTTRKKKDAQCTTCFGSLATCPGHYGYIKLELPVFHIGYFKNIIQILQCICKSCGRVLLSEEDRHKFLRRMRNPKVEVLQKRAIFKKLLDICKRQNCCPSCRDYNGTVKKIGYTLKIAHEKYL